METKFLQPLHNKKQLGEIGERIAVGELSKYGLDILLPMSDNLPYDFVIFYNNKFYKCQVKTSTEITDSEALRFSLTSNNWQTKETKEYTANEVDIFILCDLETIYLFSYEEVNGKKNIYLRKTLPKNGQIKGIILAEDYIISEERLLKLLV